MNKPVAWINYVEHSDFYDLNISGRGIPLYTHPHSEESVKVKELTDEEILEYSDVFALDYSPLYEFTAKGLVLFARAILRKAQEK